MTPDNAISTIVRLDTAKNALTEAREITDSPKADEAIELALNLVETALVECRRWLNGREV